jgi:hypothetical protein
MFTSTRCLGAWNMTLETDKRPQTRKPNTGTGLAVGAGVGVALGAAFGQLALALALGTAFGAMIDIVSHMKYRHRQ